MKIFKLFDSQSFMNQSFSFRMLNKWIQESESTGLMKSKKDEELESNQENPKENVKSEGLQQVHVDRLGTIV